MSENEELRECAESLIAYTGENPPEEPYDPIVAGLALAEAWFADNDETPLDEAWLLSMGFVEDKSPSGSKLWEKVIYVDKHGFGDGETRHWLRVHEPSDNWWPIEIYQQGDEQKEPDGVALRSWIDDTSRGHVRRLLAALGVPHE